MLAAALLVVLLLLALRTQAAVVLCLACVKSCTCVCHIFMPQHACFVSQACTQRAMYLNHVCIHGVCVSSTFICVCVMATIPA